MALVKTTINGKEIEVERDSWALDVARKMGFEIPTLCHHPALEPYGACRLCMVEVTKGKWTWLTTSCDLPIREGLSIRTDTEEVIKARKTTLELLWAEAPDAELIQEMAKKLGVEKPRFDQRTQKGKCILCGLCVAVCKKLIGCSSIGFSKRGTSRHIGTPLEEPSETCIGCNACVAICPTDYIRSEDEGPKRKMKTWRTELEMAVCETCKKPLVPIKQLEYIRGRLPENISFNNTCDKCRRSETVAKLAAGSDICDFKN